MHLNTSSTIKASRSLRKSDMLFTSVVVTMVVVFSLFSLAYLSHANSVATKGYQIKQMQEDRSQLQADLDVWNLKLVQLRSLQSIASSSYVAQMESYQETSIFIDPNPSVAMSF